MVFFNSPASPQFIENTKPTRNFFLKSYTLLYLQSKLSYFFPWKRYWVTHSLTPLRDLRYFFFIWSRKKKYRPKKYDYLGLGRWIPSKMTKNYIRSYGLQNIQFQSMLSDSFVIEMVFEDICTLYVFLLSEKVGLEKKYG